MINVHILCSYTSFYQQPHTLEVSFATLPLLYQCDNGHVLQSCWLLLIRAHDVFKKNILDTNRSCLTDVSEMPV